MKLERILKLKKVRGIEFSFDGIPKEDFEESKTTGALASVYNFLTNLFPGIEIKGFYIRFYGGIIFVKVNPQNLEYIQLNRFDLKAKKPNTKFYLTISPEGTLFSKNLDKEEEKLFYLVPIYNVMQVLAKLKEYAYPTSIGVITKDPKNFEIRIKRQYKTKRGERIELEILERKL